MEIPKINRCSARTIFWVVLLNIAFGFVEAAVVVYLRRIYYPNGFGFPLSPIADKMLIVELCREFSTIIILVSIGAIAGRKMWERFAYFMLSFGVWDMFFYLWLKATLNWPSSIFEWDILFLIPLPWIGPVIAPVSISVLLVAAGVMIICLHDKGYEFRPEKSPWILSLIGVAVILFSFMKDTGATLHQKMPQPYGYWFLIIGEALLIAAIAMAYRNTIKVYK